MLYMTLHKAQKTEVKITLSAYILPSRCRFLAVLSVLENIKKKKPMIAIIKKYLLRML